MTTAHRAGRRCPPPGAARGLSIVELMIGVTISLFILAGATLLLTTQLSDNRRLLLEVQVQQDLRAAADIITRDVRRAGYWGQSHRQVWPDPAAMQMDNPYRDTVPAAAPGGTTSLVYDRSTDEDLAPLGTDDNVVTAAERVGFRLNPANRTIDTQISDGNWQALTDPTVLTVTQFTILLNARDLPVPRSGLGPALGPRGCRLVQTARDLTVVIVGQAVHDPLVRRSLRETVRLRNDDVREVCAP